MKRRQKPQSTVQANNNRIMDKGQTNPNCTLEQDNSSSAREDIGDEDDWGGTYSSNSKLCHHEPNNLDTPLSWHDFFGPFFLSIRLFFYRSWTNFPSFAYFHTLDIRKAKPEGIYWTQGTRKDHLLLMWSWHLPTVDNVAAVPQLLHAIGLTPVHHDLRAC